MGKSEKKAQRKWLYLGEDDVARLNKLIEAFPSFNEAMILGTLCSAALKACEAMEYKVLPSAFSVGGCSPSHDESSFAAERPPRYKK